VRNATRILFLREGRIVETGTFDELTRRGGDFAEVARTQFMVPAAIAPAEAAKPVQDPEPAAEPGAAADATQPPKAAPTEPSEPV